MKSILKVTSTTAIKLTQKQVSLITKTLEKKYDGVTIRLKQIIDPTVIAGIKLTVGTEETDATTYAKLEKLHTQLKKSI